MAAVPPRVQATTPARTTLAEREAAEHEEDRLDAEDARAALAEFRASGEQTVSFDEVLAEHGLTRADLPG